MNINDLTEKDIGRFVVYTDGVGRKQEGKIKSFTDKHIFVVYQCNNEWDRYEHYIAAATNPKDLTWEGDNANT